MKHQSPNLGRNRQPTRKSEVTRERLIKAAEALFVQRGFDGVSIKDVAVEAEVTKALVFYYFKNKQQLFDTVLDRYYQAQASALVSAVGPQGSVRDRIHQGIDAYLDFVAYNPGYPRLIQREICSSSRNLEKIMEYTRPLYLWGRDVFGGLLPAEGPRSAAHLFLTVFGMIINYFTYSPALEPLWGTDPMKPQALSERREHLHFVVDAILDGMLEGKT